MDRFEWGLRKRNHCDCQQRQTRSLGSGFDDDGHLVAEGPTIGQGYRGRHQIAVAPFGPNGELELVDVLTPHLGGIVEFYQLEEKKLWL